MTLADKITILDDTIKVNQAQYNLKVFKISELSSGELGKYEYLTGEDLGYKQRVVKKAKFHYSPLGKVFNKWLEKDAKKEGLLTSVKNVKGKNEEQLKAIKEQGEKQLKVVASKTNKEAGFKNIFFKSKLNFKWIKIYNDIKNKKIDNTKLVSIGSGKYHYNATIFMCLEESAEITYSGNLPLKSAKHRQRNMEEMIRSFNKYSPNKEKYKIQKVSTLLNARQLYKKEEWLLLLHLKMAYFCYLVNIHQAWTIGKTMNWIL